MTLFSFLLFLSLYLITSSQASTPRSCRCFPGDPCWPSPQQWREFNRTLDGKLISTIPIGSVCHTSNPFTPYDPQACTELLSTWGFPETHYQSTSSPMAPWFANFSCSPFFPADSPCTIGPLPRYAVRASNVEDIRKTVRFTTRHNIRLVIRNTGHDYLGKSTGAGAVSIWTHHLKDIDFLHYTSPRYTGPAMRLGAGVQGMEAMAAAHGHGMVLVTGNCPSVGITGGYTQGGGHGQLVSRFGLAADQVLEWEVLTAAGKVVVASPSRNSDLYWALCGGGGGTYAIVLSMTVKVHPELRTSAATLSFTSAGVSGDTFWTVIREFITGILPLIDAGGVAVWLATATSFAVTPVTIPGGDINKLEGGLRSTVDMLQHYNMPYSTYIPFPNPYTSAQHQQKHRLRHSRIPFLLDQLPRDEPTEQYHRIPTRRPPDATINNRNQPNGSNRGPTNNNTPRSRCIRNIIECVSRDTTRQRRQPSMAEYRHSLYTRNVSISLIHRPDPKQLTITKKTFRLYRSRGRYREPETHDQHPCAASRSPKSQWWCLS